MILILDFGSQYTQLIARRVREAQVYCEIHPCTLPLERIRALQARGHHPLGRSGERLRRRRAADRSRRSSTSACPCSASATACSSWRTCSAAQVERAPKREYGPAELLDRRRRRISSPASTARADARVDEPRRPHRALPGGFESIAHSDNSPLARVAITSAGAASACSSTPRSSHTPRGTRDPRDFLFDVCRAHADWTLGFVDRDGAHPRAGRRRPASSAGSSGGVDSSVAAVLCTARSATSSLASSSTTACCAGRGRARSCDVLRDALSTSTSSASTPRSASSKRLAGVNDPEQKRKIIGATFIEVFEEEAAHDPERRSSSSRARSTRTSSNRVLQGPTATIKSHHNVGGLPERMKLEAHRAAARALQGRGARRSATPSAFRAIRRRHPFPGRASPSAASARSPRERARRPARRRRDRRRGDPRRRALRPIWQASPCCCRCGRSA